jgi:hypothetical protein
MRISRGAKTSLAWLGRASSWRSESSTFSSWDTANIHYFTGFLLHFDSLSISPAVCLLPLEDP